MKTRLQDNESAARLTTRDEWYTTRLLTLQSVWWKKIFGVQAPYRWNLRRLDPGFTLDIGCGIGRNLTHLNGNGVGVDHNPHSVEVARSRGLRAFTPDEFQESTFNKPGSFDSILLSHVAEHMTEREVVKLLTAHTQLLKPGGRVIIITPQEFGFRSDPTHVLLMDFERLRKVEREAGLMPVGEYSFPFPRIFGRVFKYNEFVSISKKG
ncbi:MAG TPA: class I SAM-dependent methyltransferase [Blastocatellia bacterium]|jgi:SAM-dependent methyltransferase|nr:class I SAM-dependent methyltransferase [Blastocatellia bacterium]